MDEVEIKNVIYINNNSHVSNNLAELPKYPCWDFYFELSATLNFIVSIHAGNVTAWVSING